MAGMDINAPAPNAATFEIDVNSTDTPAHIRVRKRFD
jgi:hypothetical protein